MFFITTSLFSFFEPCRHSFCDFSLDRKVTKRSSRHECRPLCPPSDSGGKSKLDAYALLHAAVGGRPFTPHPHRMSALPPHASSGSNSPSLRFDEGASAEPSLLWLCRARRRKGRSPNGWPEAGVVKQAQTVGFLVLHTPRFSTQAIRKSGIKVKISMRKFLMFIYGSNCVSQLPKAL